MTILKNIGLVIITLFVVLGCEDENFDIETYGTIKGVVVDGENYQPLEGVQIVTNPASTATITSSEGSFEFHKIKEGELAITARKKDYLSSTVSVAVYENETTNLNFYLLKDENDVGWVEIYDPVPGNGAVDQDVSFTFSWNVDQQYSSKELVYSVYYFESNSTVQQIAGENLVDEEVTVDGLDYSTSYYWYVVARYEGERVANSPTWTFKTKDDSE